MYLVCEVGFLAKVIPQIFTKSLGLKENMGRQLNITKRKHREALFEALLVGCVFIQT
jgi:hypothetical protein